MVTIGDKYYVFELAQILRFVNYSDKNPTKAVEILDSYENGAATSKTIRELTTPGNIQIDNISYDLLKIFIGQIITFEGQTINDLEELPFGMKLAVNTMLKFKILIEVNEE